MPIDRFFIDSELTTSPGNIILEDMEFHHLAHVVRIRVDETVELIDGKGSLAIARLIKLGKKQAHLKLESLKKEPQPSFRLILAQAAPRQNRLDTIMEKGTELGMTDLWLFPGLSSEKKEFKENLKERLKKIAISAIKQCGRLHLPEIHFHPFLESWRSPPLPLYFGDLDLQAKSFLECWKVNTPSNGLIFCIGPESGFQDKELESLKRMGGVGVKLHHNILRTDTASLVALSQVSMFFL